MRHEIFKQGAGPGDRAGVCPLPAHRPVERAPVPVRHLPGRNRIIAHRACFAHQEIIVGANPVPILIQPDGKQLPVGVVKDRKVCGFQDGLNLVDDLLQPGFTGYIFIKTLLECHQSTEVVPAVHRRDKPVREHPQIIGRIPVIEVPMAGFKLPDRFKGARKPQRKPGAVDQMQIPRRKVGKQQHPDIGRGGTARHTLHRRELHVIGRQVMVFRVGVVLVIAEHLRTPAQQFPTLFVRKSGATIRAFPGSYRR